MTKEQVMKAIDELKAQGYTEEEIVGSFYAMFADDKITLQELEDIVNLLGYEFTEEFRNMSPEEQKTKGIEQKEDKKAEGVTDKEVEDAKEITPDEIKEIKEEKTKEEKPEDKKASPNGDDEEKEAGKLFGFDGNKEEAKETKKDEEDEEEKEARKLFGF